MSELRRYLPPFAGDYTGACSALYNLSCLVIIVDAGCCTRNYTEYDETRWARRRRATFSAQLRTLDAVLGNDEAIVSQAVDAVRELAPSCVAIVGTPVPAVVGMDLAGIAREIEAESGVAALGVATTGFDTYEAGASRAFELLCDRFARAGGGEGFGARAAADGATAVNVLGCTVQDFGSERALEELSVLVEDAGMRPVWNTAMPFGLADIAAASQAQASVVVSWSGLAAARMLRERFGVPIVAGRPETCAEARILAEEVRTGACRPLWEAVGEPLGAACTGDSGERAMLFVGEQVAMNMERARMRRCAAEGGRASGRREIVASLFSMERSWMEPGDLAFEGERDLVAFAREHPGFLWRGDPLFQRVPGYALACDRPMPHQAVSSSLFLLEEPCVSQA